MQVVINIRPILKEVKSDSGNFENFGKVKIAIWKSLRKSVLNRRVDVDLGSIPAEEDEAKLVIVLGDQERREPVYLGDKPPLNFQHRRRLHLLLLRHCCHNCFQFFTTIIIDREPR